MRHASLTNLRRSPTTPPPSCLAKIFSCWVKIFFNTSGIYDTRLAHFSPILEFLKRTPLGFPGILCLKCLTGYPLFGYNHQHLRMIVYLAVVQHLCACSLSAKLNSGEQLSNLIWHCQNIVRLCWLHAA